MILEEDKAFARAMLGDEVVNAAEENAVLVHEGVKGMKWGIWNAETRARRLRERGLKKARKAKARKARLAKAKLKAEEKERAEFQRLSDTKVYKHAQDEFKRKVYDAYRNIDKMSIAEVAAMKSQIDAGAALLDVKIQPPPKKTSADKIRSASAFLADVGKNLGTLGSNIPNIVKGYQAIFGDTGIDPDVSSAVKTSSSKQNNEQSDKQGNEQGNKQNKQKKKKK